ncbi:MAG: LysM peptidoglycan-binding domain-containing protein [Leptolyngbya sp. Prado105]|jgi:predicted chitinase|nr:LysM peptidoglycan-binding domain-containing protein [Leptolyngbya sp. Prado105]
MPCISGKSYIVQAGDTLFLIAQQQLGDGNRWREIQKTDSTPVTDADTTTLRPGQELCIPNGSVSPPSPSLGKGFKGIVPSATFEAMFPNRNGFYSYEGLVAATQKYPSFCNDGTDEQCKREAAAFLANIAHETGGLKYVEELNTANWSHYCDPNIYPCIPGKTYHGRGPIQLSWNYNYAACGTALGIDLLNNPDLVATDSSISFMTALWFWMTPQPPKLSCHNAIRTSGFGMTINIINGGIECGRGQVTPQAQNRIQLYQQFTNQLGVTPGENLAC